MGKRGPKVALNPVGYKCINVLVQNAIGRVKTLAKKRYNNKILNAEQPEINRSRVTQWQKDNPEKTNAKNRKWARDHPSEIYHKQVKYKTENRELVRERERVKYHTDLVHQTRVKLRKRLKLWVGKAKAGRTMDMVALPVEDFVSHLEQQGSYKHDDQLDHIFPLAVYDVLDPEQQHKAMNYTNFQPLTAFENNEKGTRWPTKAMAAKVERWAWPDGVTVDMLPDRYPGWSTALRM